MRVCIVGAGAIGGLLGARLSAAGEHVSVFARGESLAAIRDHLSQTTGSSLKQVRLTLFDQPTTEVFLKVWESKIEGKRG